MANRNLRATARAAQRTAPQTTTLAALTSAPQGSLHDNKALIPLGALMLAASVGSWAQAAAPADGKTLQTVTVRERAEAPEGKDSVRATETTIGKGKQKLRDIPQSITVVTEKLIDDRNLDTIKDVLRQTAGITFKAAEGGEEDISLRGFSLAGTGDIFMDGMRDPAFYDRDTFNNDRIEVLRGSASMLFGRGSTGGAVNQVSKQPRLINENEITTTLGSHNYKRVLGDFNLITGENAALRLNAMATKADNNGAGSSIDKTGIAAAYRFGIGTADEFSANVFYLNNQNGMNYGIPWIRPNTTDASDKNTLIGSLKPTDYLGLSSDYSAGKATVGTLAHTHRFSHRSELKTQLRAGSFERNQRASAVRFLTATDLGSFNPATEFRRGTNLKVQDVTTLQLQTDFNTKFEALGVEHALLAGADYSRERKTVYSALNAAQGGVDLVKPNITAGQTGGGGSVDESSRRFRVGNQFESNALGLYAQDLIQVAPHWKVLAGLRYDSMRGSYNNFSIPNNATGPATTVSYQQKISELSKRLGLLYQPNALHSYHLSWGTSFNTSGDTYSYNALSANTDPEQSQNIELGAKLDSADKRFTTRLAIFHATKKNERNTDPDTAATRLLLSGKRHTAGFEADISGRITPQWEVFGSYMWMPIAKVDEAASTVTTVGNRAGDRPGLSPRLSGTVWTTYQLTPKWRVGGGLNFRSSQSPADVTAPAWEAPGFVTADLLAEYTISDRYIVKANLSNITNKLYADSLYRGHYIPGAGRMLQVAFTAKF